MAQSTNKAVVLHSGGLDSTLCLLLAQREQREVLSLGVDYGQQHRIELEYARFQCERWGITRRVVRVEWSKPDRPIPTGRSIEEMRTGISPAFLPGRNIVFLALAAAEAGGISAGEIWIGVNAVDFSGYPDCRPEFISDFQKALDGGFPGGPELKAPLLHLTKPQIAKLATHVGLERGDTWSCYRPSYVEHGLRPCGHCDACVLNSYAWDESVNAELPRSSL